MHFYREKSHLYAKTVLKEDYKVSLMQKDMEKYTNSNSAHLEEILRTNRFQPLKSDRLVFQRFLGHYEILNGFRWHETTDDKCYFCQNWSYSLFLWDKELSKILYQSVPRDEFGIKPKHSIISPTVCSIESI